MNCRGLAECKKRRDILQFVREKSYNIAFLQDIHIEQQNLNKMKAEWGSEIVASTYTSNSRGVAFLLKNNFEYKIEDIKTDNNGNFCILQLEVTGKKLCLVNIYGPNHDNPSFYEELFLHIAELQYDSLVCGGDWNLVMDPTVDTVNYVKINNPKARQVVLDLMEAFNLTDIWRQQHLGVREYTWRQPLTRKQSRLDFFFV